MVVFPGGFRVSQLTLLLLAATVLFMALEVVGCIPPLTEAYR
jgi:hypothetical protein